LTVALWNLFPGGAPFGYMSKAYVAPAELVGYVNVAMALPSSSVVMVPS